MNKELNQMHKVLILIGICCFTIGLYVRFKTLGFVSLNEWALRDFDRAIHLINGNYFPLAGPEATNGGRLPGPFFYVLLSIPLFFHISHESIINFNLLINIICHPLLFFVTRHYFGWLGAFIASILLALSIPHIGSVSAPMNPTFIFPFIIILYYFLYGVITKRTSKNLPYIVLVIALSIQIHYSIATFILAIILIVVILRIKIRLKHTFISIVLLCIIFSPFTFYKTHVFEKKINKSKIDSLGKVRNSLPSVSRIISKKGSFQTIQPQVTNFSEKTNNILGKIFLQNVFKRIALTSKLQYSQSFDSVSFLLNYIFILVSFYFLLFSVIYKIYRKTKIEKFSIDILILLMFIVPGWIYEVLQPAYAHYWYNYIFIIPLILVQTYFFTSILNYFGSHQNKITITLITVIISYFAYSSIYFSNVINRPIKVVQYDSGPKNRLLFSILMNKLSLGAREFYEKVFVNELSANSLNKLKFINKSNSTLVEIPLRKQSFYKNCYFIFEKFSIVKSHRGQSYEFKRFINDKTINIISKKHLPLSGLGPATDFYVYLYQPKFNQPCYRNSFNSFATEPKFRELLFKSYGIDKTNSSPNIRQILKKSKYNINSLITFLNSEYIAYDQNLGVPIQFLIKLSKEKKQSIFSVEINYYSYSGIQNVFNLTNLNIQIETLDNFGLPENSTVFQIISPDSWLSHYSSTNTYTNKLSWKRRFILPNDFKLEKDYFRVYARWSAQFPLKDNTKSTSYNGTFKFIN
jgi:hypothetical protein